MLTLSDGGGWAPSRRAASILVARRGQSLRRRYNWWGSRALSSGEPSRYMLKLACHVAEACESPEEVGLAVHGYERLASLALARKLQSDDHVTPGERHQMMRDARLPGYLYANPATEAIFTSTADQLGKGGFIGQIGKAVSKATTGIGKAVNRALIPATRSLQAVGDISQGLMNNLKHAVSGVGSNVANFAASPQGTGAILGALTGDPGLGPIGAGVPNSPGYDASGQPLPTGTGVPIAFNPNTIIYAGAAVLLAYLLFGGERRR